MNEAYILAIDQGTTGSTALLFNEEGAVISRGYREIRQIYPRPGWVEHDPEEILESCLRTAGKAARDSGVPPTAIKAVGITNQRETTIVWERETGKPVCNAIVWQCRRTAPLCEKLKKAGMEQSVREKTGLPVDAYFSATKLRWILDNIPDGQKRAERGELLFGTVDSWLAWKLTGGNAHITDYSNASRTMLYNINTLEWDEDLLRALDIPRVILPEVVPSSQIYGETVEGMPLPGRVPLAGMAGDQQSALFGQACYSAGLAKNTYGTGSFVLVNLGGKPVFSRRGLVTTLAWGIADEVTYALEGSIFITGAAIQWLRDGLGLIQHASESEALAVSVSDNGGVYFVPAFVGLGAPHWDMYARGTILGLTRGSSRAHLTRAALEAIAYQTRDVIDAMKQDAGVGIPLLRVDGGGSANRFLMQFQADILGIPLQCAHTAETTALGAAYLAGLAVGMWRDTADIARNWHSSATFEPAMSGDERESLYHDWKRALERAVGWCTDVHY